MKRLSDAERDGDRVYAVIKGIGASSDGRGKSIYAPAPRGQVKAIERAYEAAGVPLETVELIEAHGTGTRAGDVAEIAGLKEVFSKADRKGRWVALGSVKSQIGHSKSAAGVAGLVKAAMALHQRALPPTARVTTPNPKMDLERSPLYLNPVARPWIRAKDHPRRAGVSSFGFGGSNFHCVLEEHGDPDAAPPLHAAEAELVLIGAPDAATLGARIEDATRGISASPTLPHAARDLLNAWSPAPHVVGFTARTLDELRARLDTARALVANGAPGERDGVVYGIPKPDHGRVAVVFPGQGSQYVDMGRTMALRHPMVRAAMDRADEPAFDDATRRTQEAALTATEWAQPAIGALSKGLYDLLSRFSVRPEAVAGHSYGELVALHAAGVLDEEGLWTASRVRGEAMADRGSERGTMAAVSGPLDALRAVLDGLSDDVVLANRNHPQQGVISGSAEGVERALEALAKAGLSGTRLRVSAAFHSALVADARAPFEDALQQIPFHAPRIPVYSTVTAAPYPAEKEAARRLLAEQIITPVDWVGVVEALYDRGVRTFLECGPHGVLSGLVSRTLADRGAVVVSLDRHRGQIDGDVQLKEALVR
ncbi:MAG: acyltransferase domain-containing protein, partial [Deltaproteobacteria bacterium]|nr:acyltransferase domain-containing protein [Deltaproteobacteria bacterium]